MAESGARAATADDSEHARVKKLKGPRKNTLLKIRVYRLFVDLCQDLRLTVTRAANLNVAVTHLALDQGLHDLFAGPLGHDDDTPELQIERRQLLDTILRRLQPNIDGLPTVDKDGATFVPLSAALAICKPQVPPDLVNYTQTIMRVLDRNNAPRTTPLGAYVEYIAKNMTGIFTDKTPRMLPTPASQPPTLLLVPAVPICNNINDAIASSANSLGNLNLLAAAAPTSTCAPAHAVATEAAAEGRGPHHTTPHHTTPHPSHTPTTTVLP